MKELITLSGLGILSLIAEILNIRKLIYPIVLIGLALNIAFCVQDFGHNEMIYNMMQLDNTALVFTILFSFIAILWFFMARNSFTDDTNMSDHFSLVLFSLVGVLLLSSYTHLSMLFLGVEILSIPVYVLVGSDKRNVYSNEAAFKYFLLGAFAGGFLLLGIAFVYGASGSFYSAQIAASALTQLGLSKQLLAVGFILILFAFSFKMAAVPFHFWAPDVYSGAPTTVTAYMAAIVKIGAVAGFYRFYIIIANNFRGEDFFYGFHIVLLTIAVLSIVIGNIIAASQSNLKRLLAYSGSSHIGFILLGTAMTTMFVQNTILYYLVAYSISVILAFWVMLIVFKQDNSVDISSFNGLVKRNPLLAGVMTIALLSMAGIPPLGGFFAKYFVLLDVITRGYILVAVIAILASLIGVYYYFRIIIAMFAKVPVNDDVITLNTTTKLALIVVASLLIAIGIFPEFVLNLFIN